MYQDGRYRGEGKGKEGKITVEVVVKYGKIASIVVLSHNGTPTLAEKVFKFLTKLILEKNSPKVDAVAGATLSSIGFKAAVEDALIKARKNKG